MQALQTRIDSFHKSKRVRRYPNKPSSSTVKWPHPPHFKANANTLAEAGFFFSPSWDDRDSVACFLCGKELSDWDADDDPFEIHYAKCRDSCAWAVVRCGLLDDLDNKGRFVFKKMRLPSSKAMEKARLETFGQGWWPHDSDSDHGATSVKMAHAGFVYTPQTAGDDTVTCLYCNLSLGGWEREDDPVQEHHRRDSKSACPFLAHSDDELDVVDPPPPRARRGKTRPTTSSRGRRKTKATRGKSIKESIPVSRRSPSPSQADSREHHSAPILNVDILPASDPAPKLVTRSPISNDSIHSLRHTPVSPPTPRTPSKIPNTWPNGTPSYPDLVSSSPAGQVLTDSERVMTLEQWIRQEISLGYERLLTDGQRQIALFKARAAELRKCIDEL